MMLELGAINYNGGLAAACASGNNAVVKMMLDLGANNYEESFHMAVMAKHFEIAKLLFSKVTNKNISLPPFSSLEFKILVNSKDIDLSIKNEHPEYHLLNFYNINIPDIDRLINKYLF